MKPRKLFLVFLIFALIVNIGFPSEVWAKKRKIKSRSVSARAAVFYNTQTGRRYFTRNENLRVPPASTTKVMTALLVLERLPLDKVLTAGPRAVLVQPSTINLRVGEKFTVRDLLFALLMNSANDASVVLADGVAGSEKEFVELMNRKARELGAVNTRFTSSNGLPTRGIAPYTTPSDMSIIFRKALENDFFRRAIKLRYFRIVSAGGRPVLLKSHNKILLSNWKHKIYGKTGYTRAARQCFVGYVMKGDDLCVIAVYGCSRRWKDIKYIVERFGGIDL